MLLVPPPLIFVLALDKLAEPCIALAFPDSWTGHVDVGHVAIAHHALNANFLLRGRILWSVHVLHWLWGVHGWVGTVEERSRADRGLLAVRRRRTWREELGLVGVGTGLRDGRLAVWGGCGLRTRGRLGALGTADSGGLLRVVQGAPGD